MRDFSKLRLEKRLPNQATFYEVATAASDHEDRGQNDFLYPNPMSHSHYSGDNRNNNNNNNNSPEDFPEHGMGEFFNPSHPPPQNTNRPLIGKYYK